MSEKAAYFADTPNENKRIAVGSHGYYENETNRRVASYVNAPGYIYGMKKGSKTEHPKVNGEQERYSCYTNALVVFTDIPLFPSTDSTRPLSDVPDFFELRRL
ncbi:hypothetical protein V4C56_07450 [Paraburkholderia azotifigens]|uniref:Uncharacterized protein n=1 Tax=Paraburkholderia azotifigens TaxID=2057004 RepID=A0ABU9QYW4_9BURK